MDCTTAEFSSWHVGQNNQKYGWTSTKPVSNISRWHGTKIPHLFSTTARPILSVSDAISDGRSGVVAALNVATGCGLRTLPFRCKTRLSAPSNDPPNGCYLPGTVTGKSGRLQGAHDRRLHHHNNSVHRTDLGIERDKGPAEYRFTPNPGWDVKVAYSHERRFGTQETGFLFGSAGTWAPLAQVPRPISDTTQDATLSAEYAGDSFRGQEMERHGKL